MRYINRKSGASIELSDLDGAKKRLYESAVDQFRKKVSWFEFEQFVFSYTSPLFSQSRSRADALEDPLYAALKDMWLQLGIDQGFVADDREQTQARAAGAHRPTVIRDAPLTHQPRVPRRRGR
jgi:hypothetical protein